MRWFVVLGLIVCLAGLFLLTWPETKASRPAISPFFTVTRSGLP
jgi:uncharacterized membrane protein HdeD (DUF308 family)